MRRMHFDELQLFFCLSGLESLLVFGFLWVKPTFNNSCVFEKSQKILQTINYFGAENALNLQNRFKFYWNDSIINLAVILQTGI